MLTANLELMVLQIHDVSQLTIITSQSQVHLNDGLYVLIFDIFNIRWLMLSLFE